MTENIERQIVKIVRKGKTVQNVVEIKKLYKIYGPFLWMGLNCFKARTTLRRQFTFYQKVPRNSWYSFYQPQMDERLVWLVTDWEARGTVSVLQVMKLETFEITYMGKMQIIVNLFQEMIQTVYNWNALVKQYHVDKKSMLTWIKKAL